MPLCCCALVGTKACENCKNTTGQMGYPNPTKNERVSTGWECPKCGAVYSPSMMFCTNCQGVKKLHDKSKSLTVKEQCDVLDDIRAGKK